MLPSYVEALERLFSTAQPGAVLQCPTPYQTDIYKLLALLAIQTLHTKFPTAPTVKLAEWVTHATRLCAPKLRV
jgi:hypothetical protein